MAQRSRASQKKRQRELQRQEKARDKVARREQRKIEKSNPGEVELNEFGEPIEPDELNDLDQPEMATEPEGVVSTAPPER
jgi:hypothetical protein